MLAWLASRPARGAWIETGGGGLCRRDRLSRPARGAWIETCSAMGRTSRRGCRAPHGARGLKPVAEELMPEINGRAPHGARGLKLAHGKKSIYHGRSRPARGAWIETSSSACVRMMRGGRAPHGARGLKPRGWRYGGSSVSRAPHGARGLKLL